MDALYTLNSSQYQRSNHTYNTLRCDDEQPRISDLLLTNLAQLFIKFEAQDYFAVHLVHRHNELPPDHIMLGTKFTDCAGGWWTRPTSTKNINPRQIHGHIFKVLDQEELVPYEYREGPACVDLIKVRDGFLEAFTEFVATHELGDILGLQVLGHDTPPQDMFELVLSQQDTIMLCEGKACHGGPYRTTGWIFDQDDLGLASFKGNEAHASPPNGGPHQAFRDGKPFRDIGAVLKFLVTKGIVEGGTLES